MPRSQGWATLHLARAWSPICNGGLNEGLIFSLRGIQLCTKKAEWESMRPVFLQGGDFFLTPGCPVSLGAEAHAGQGLEKWPLQTLQASWASGRPRHAHPTDIPQLGFRDAAGSFCCDAHRWQGPCRTEPWDRGPLPFPASLSDPPSEGPLGSSFG